MSAIEDIGWYVVDCVHAGASKDDVTVACDAEGQVIHATENEAQADMFTFVILSEGEAYDVTITKAAAWTT